MTEVNRDRVLAKIRALLSKTVDNGCSESEAMAALEKAQTMMDAYEVTEEDLKIAKESRASIIDYDGGHDTHGISASMSWSVAQLYDCTCYTTRMHGSRTKKIKFVGLPADVDMARWLLDMLSEFVRRELAAWLLTSGLPKGGRRSAIHAFVIGATSRINKRLVELKQQSRAKASGNSTALVVCKEGAIKDALKAADVHLTVGKSRRTYRDERAFGAGQSAGNRATFGKGIMRPAPKLGYGT